MVVAVKASGSEKSPFSSSVSVPAPPLKVLLASTERESRITVSSPAPAVTANLPLVSAAPLKVRLSPAPSAVATMLSVALMATLASLVVMA